MSCPDVPVPPGLRAAQVALADLLAVMARLRDPLNGCPWDRRQGFTSLAPYTLEEAYEVVDAIQRDDPNALCAELGDLLFQVVFHARVAEEAGLFDFAGVTNASVDKLRRRHPHVFAGADPAEADWEAIKAAEREAAAGGASPSALAGVARALPSLTRAVKLQRRATRAGLDGGDRDAAWAQLQGQQQRLAALLAQSVEGAEAAEVLGDWLFAGARLARHLALDPEAACRAAGERYARRCQDLEARSADAD